MIRDFNKNDFKSIYELGTVINKNFKNLFNLDDVLNSEIENIIVYDFEGVILSFLHYNELSSEVNILNIATLDAGKRQGIASKLVDDLKRKTKKDIFLEVSSENKEAINFYLKNNFSVINTREKYYPGSDAFGMKYETKKDVFILGVETTCDETALAISKNGKEIVKSVVNTQIEKHKIHGGVVPELASRMHVENITILLEELLSDIDLTLSDISAVAVSSSPGLLGSLLVGVEFAKVISFACNKPLIKVNHLVAHIYASKIENDVEFPLLALIVSGGHTELFKMDKDYSFTLLASTLDDALGECFDKVARVLDLPYPGGPGVESLALKGENIHSFPVYKSKDGRSFSYSGLKSSVINYLNKNKVSSKENIATSFQTSAIDQVLYVLEENIKKTNIKNIILAGGVSANMYLREKVKILASRYNGELYVPSLKYCTDNAAMVSVAAYPLFLEGKFSSLALNSSSRSKIV